MTELETGMEQVGSVPKTRKSGFAGNVFKLASGTMVAQILAIVLSPIFTRFFAPEAFGTAAVFTSILSVLGVLVCLRYELAIMLPEKDEDAAALLVGSLFFVGWFTVLTMLGVLFLREPICRWLKAPELEPFLWMLPIAVLASGSYLALRYWKTRSERFGLLSSMRVAASVGSNGVKLGTGLMGFVGPGSLIGANVLGGVVPMAGLAYATWRDDRHLLLQTSWKQIVQGLKRYRKFPLVTTWSSLLNALSLQLPTMLLSAFFSQTIVGYYALGIRMIQLPVTLISNAIRQVFFQRASQALNEGNLDLLVQSTCKRLVSLGLFPLLGLGLIGQEAFVVILGSKWAEAGVYMQIISLWWLVVFVGSPMSVLLDVLERQGVGLTYNIFLLVFRVLSLTIGGRSGNARLTLALYAGVGLVMSALLITWLLRASNASTWNILWHVGYCLLCAAPVLLFVSAAKWWWQWQPWSVLVLAGVGALVYYGLVIWEDSSLMKLVFQARGRVGKRDVN